jgi:hypothetical protein
MTTGLVTQAQRVAGVAVDAARRSPADFYPTPPEATEALLRVEHFHGPIWEPACGDGAISKVLEAAGYEVASSDLYDRGYGTVGVDFLAQVSPARMNIVTNPPYRLVLPFARHAVAITRRHNTAKVALLLRLACLEGQARRAFFESSPLARVWVFSRRVQFKRPGWEDTGKGGMVAYAWYVWEHGHKGPPLLGWV